MLVKLGHRHIATLHSFWSNSPARDGCNIEIDDECGELRGHLEAIIEAQAWVRPTNTGRHNAKVECLRLICAQ